MRIIAGEFRSRKLQSPPEKSETRPIPDRVKESLFGILRGHFEDVHVLDAFAGTGSVGLEALSRGAAFCTFIERDRAVAGVLEANIKMLGCMDRCEIVVGDALAASSLARIHEKVHVAFFDPPYAVVENALGWRRTRDQLARTIALLDAGGYLIHRTPSPFTHSPENAGAAEESHAPPVPDDESRHARGGRSNKIARKSERRHARSSSEVDADGDPHADPLADPEADPGSEGGSEVRRRSSRRSAPPVEMPPTELSLDLSDPSAEAELIAFEEQLAEIMRAPSRQDVDLSIPGAIGPETHIYGTTAIHLYQAQQRSLEQPTPSPI